MKKPIVKKPIIQLDFVQRMNQMLAGKCIKAVTYRRDRDTGDWYPILVLGSRETDPKRPGMLRDYVWGEIEIRQDDEDNGPGVPVFHPSAHARKALKLKESDNQYGLWELLGGEYC